MIQSIAMASPLPTTIPDIPFHVPQLGNNRQIVFGREAGPLYYLTLLRKHKDELKSKLHHVSLMLEPSVEDSLGEDMMRSAVDYRWYLDERYAEVRHVWRGTCESSTLDRQNHSVRCGLRMNLNPVRAGLVLGAGDLRPSSYGTYALDESENMTPDVLDMDPYYWVLGKQ